MPHHHLLQLLRSIEINKDNLILSIGNLELRIVLNELLKNVLEYDKKRVGTYGSESNPVNLIHRPSYI